MDKTILKMLLEKFIQDTSRKSGRDVTKHVSRSNRNLYSLNVSPGPDNSVLTCGWGHIKPLKEVLQIGIKRAHLPVGQPALMAVAGTAWRDVELQWRFSSEGDVYEEAVAALTAVVRNR